MSAERLVRFSLAAAALAGVASQSTPAWADNTTLSVSFTAAAYKIATTVAPGLSVPGASSSADGATSTQTQFPTVTPVQPVTVVATVNAAHPVTSGSLIFFLDNTALATLPVVSLGQTFHPIALPGPGVTGPRALTATTSYGASLSLKIPAGGHALSIRYSGANGFSMSAIAGNVASIAHTALDLDCTCNAGGAAVACGPQPAGSPAAQLTCKSNVYAETWPAGQGTPIWGLGPSGFVTFADSAAGARAVQVVTTPNGTSATLTRPSPTVAGTFTMGSSFTPQSAGTFAPSQGPTKTYQK
jgi:hypothetical protein